MIDILLLVVFGIVTWCVASEGAWGAALICLCVLFAGLLAMNFFEPLALLLENVISKSPAWSVRWDVISLVGLFTGFVWLLRTATEHLHPKFIQVHPLLYEGVRWACGALAGYVTMAFLLTALHTAPLPREFLGFKPERKNFFGTTAPDRQWLGFTQYVSEKAYHRGRIFDGPRYEFGEQPNKIWPSFPIRYATRRQTPSSAIAVPPAKEGGLKRKGRRSRTGKPAF